jgi:hypothetical protein
MSGGIRSKQLNLDEDLDMQGKNLVNVGSIAFSGGATGSPVDAPSITAHDLLQAGTNDSSVMLQQAALVEFDTRTRVIDKDGSTRLSRYREKDGATTILDAGFTFDAQGRIATVATIIHGNTVTHTFTYTGTDTMPTTDVPVIT